MRLNPYPCSLKIKRVSDLGDALALTISDKNDITVVLSDKADAGHCCHEACHVRQAVEDYIELTLDNESQAYLEQFVCEKLLEKLQK